MRTLEDIEKQLGRPLSGDITSAEYKELALTDEEMAGIAPELDERAKKTLQLAIAMEHGPMSLDDWEKIETATEHWVAANRAAVGRSLDALLGADAEEE